MDGANRAIRDSQGSFSIRAGTVQVSQHLPARAQEQSRAKCRAERDGPLVEIARVTKRREIDHGWTGALGLGGDNTTKLGDASL